MDHYCLYVIMVPHVLIGITENETKCIIMSPLNISILSVRSLMVIKSQLFLEMPIS